MHDVGSARLHVQRWHLQTNMPPRSFHCQNYIWRRNKFLKVCVFVSIFWYIYIISFLLIWYFRQLQQIWASNSWGGEQDIHQYRHRRGLCDLITVGIVPWVYPRYPCSLWRVVAGASNQRQRLQHNLCNLLQCGVVWAPAQSGRRTSSQCCSDLLTAKVKVMIMQAQNNKSNQGEENKPEPVLVPMNLEFVKVLIRPFVMWSSRWTLFLLTMMWLYQYSIFPPLQTNMRSEHWNQRWSSNRLQSDPYKDEIALTKAEGKEMTQCQYLMYQNQWHTP